jgi:hypothetical protein
MINIRVVVTRDESNPSIWIKAAKPMTVLGWEMADLESQGTIIYLTSGQ